MDLMLLVADLKLQVADLIHEVAGLRMEVPELRPGEIRLNLTTECCLVYVDDIIVFGSPLTCTYRGWPRSCSACAMLV